VDCTCRGTEDLHLPVGRIMLGQRLSRGELRRSWEGRLIVALGRYVDWEEELEEVVRKAGYWNIARVRIWGSTEEALRF
jgi:hypothetical protein